MIAGRPVTHPLKPWGETEGGEESGWRNDLGSLQTLVPFHVQHRHPSQNHSCLCLSPCFFLSISQQGDKVRLVGRTNLQANRYHTFNATSVSQWARGPPAAQSAVVSDPRCEAVGTVETNISAQKLVNSSNFRLIFCFFLCLSVFFNFPL